MRAKICLALLLALGMFGAASAQPYKINLQVHACGPYAVLLDNKAVQDDLKLTQDQVSRVEEWTTKFFDTAKQIRINKGIPASPEEKAEALRANLNEYFKKEFAAQVEIKKVSFEQLGDILAKPQLERLKQIDRQKRGIHAISDDEVVSTLALTEAQQTTLTKLSAEEVKGHNALMTGPLRKRGEHEEYQKKLRAVEKEYYDKGVAVLTPEQAKKWKEMIGEPFDLVKLEFQPLKR